MNNLTEEPETCLNFGEYGAGRWVKEYQKTLGKLTLPPSFVPSGGFYI